MKTMISYQAINGRIFEDYDECRLYEYKITHVPEHLTLWAEDMTHLEGDGTLDGMEEVLRSADYIDVADFEGKVFKSWQEALEFLEGFWGLTTDGIDGPGSFKFNYEQHEWERIEENV